MSEAIDNIIIARCGLVCSECGAFKKQKCGGCESENPCYKGCKIRPCAQSKEISTCAQCGDFEHLKDCKKLHNFIAMIFKFIFRSDRLGNLAEIRQVGIEKYIEKIKNKSE